MPEAKPQILVIDSETLRTIIVEAVRDALHAAGVRETPGAYLPVTDAAKIASVTPQTIRMWINSGRLTRYRAGRALRVHRDDLERLLTTPNLDDGMDIEPELRALRDLGATQR